MRNLDRIEEFRREAEHALFTKQQALSVAFLLLQLELACEKNDDHDKRVLESALSKIALSYFDTTATQTDQILDEAGVARLTSENIADAIDIMVFEANSLM